jgi:hypothetical protein
MRKISQTRSLILDRTISGLDRYPSNPALRDTRPLRIPGATITSWSESLDIDLAVFFAGPVSGASIAGAASPGSTQPGHRPAGHTATGHTATGHTATGTVSLSDGTKIEFATITQFDIAEST